MKRIPSVALGRHLSVIVGLALASTVGNLSAADTYYVSDHLATTTAVADAAGEIASLEADAFGSPVNGGEQAARYTGKPYDTDIGAYVFPFRNYRSDEARWMSADPSGFPDGVNSNLYSPCPTSDIDPLGLARVYGDNILYNYIYTRTLTQAQQLSITSYTVTNSTDNSIAGSYTGSIGVSNSGVNATIAGTSGFTEGSGYSFSSVTSWGDFGSQQRGAATGDLPSWELTNLTPPSGSGWTFDSWIISPAVYDTTLGAPTYANVTVNSRDVVQVETSHWQAHSRWYRIE